jgi:hypothetical protein
MSAAQLIEEIESLPPDQPLDWAAISQRVNAEFSAAATSEERGEILAVRAAAIEVLEIQLELHGDQLEKFIDVCDLDYKRLIVQEASVDSHISFEKMLNVTDREIKAGRMSEDFALRQIAKEETGRVGEEAIPPAAAASAESAFDKLKHWLHLGS